CILHQLAFDTSLSSTYRSLSSSHTPPPQQLLFDTSSSSTQARLRHQLIFDTSQTSPPSFLVLLMYAALALSPDIANMHRSHPKLKMAASLFLIMLVMLLRLHQPLRPRRPGNLIGPVILAVVAFVLAIAFVIHRIHAHRVGISTWWRNRNPSLVALPRSPIGPYRPIELAVIRPHHLQLSDRMARDNNESRLSIRGFLSGAGGAGPGLVGVGVGNPGNNATVDVPGGPVSLGVGFDSEWQDAEMRHFGLAFTAWVRRRGGSMQMPGRETPDGQSAGHRRAASEF
ncbi:hypothetical protein B0T11DRAFT_358882, partial [Plectosphaerella cucumerina]